MRRSKHLYSESDDSEDSESDDERERRRRRRGKKQRKDKKQRGDRSRKRSHKNKELVQPEPQETAVTEVTPAKREIVVMEFTQAQREVMVQFLLNMQAERLHRLQDIILTAVEMEKSFERFKTKDDEMEFNCADFNDRELSAVIHVCQLKKITPPQI